MPHVVNNVTMKLTHLKLFWWSGKAWRCEEV